MGDGKGSLLQTDPLNKRWVASCRKPASLVKLETKYYDPLFWVALVIRGWPVTASRVTDHVMYGPRIELQVNSWNAKYHHRRRKLSFFFLSEPPSHLPTTFLGCSYLPIFSHFVLLEFVDFNTGLSDTKIPKNMLPSGGQSSHFRGKLASKGGGSWEDANFGEAWLSMSHQTKTNQNK